MEKTLLFFTLLLLSASSAFSQFNEPDEKLILINKIREYKITEQDPNDNKSDLHNRIMKQMKFNKTGKKIYKYTFNVDVIYTKDSVLYGYDEKGNLIEVVDYYIDFPIGKEQMKVVEELGMKIDTTKTIYKSHYNATNQEIRNEEFSNNKLSNQEIFSYDSLGKIIKKQRLYFSSPESNNCDITYLYNNSGQLINTKEIHPATNELAETSYTYDVKGNKIKEENKGKWKNNLVSYSYNDKNQLLEIVSDGIGFDYDKTPFHIVINYTYDVKGNLIEYKQLSNNELRRWEKYSYNDKNLISEELWMDEKSGKASTRLLYSYLYYK